MSAFSCEIHGSHGKRDVCVSRSRVKQTSLCKAPETPLPVSLETLDSLPYESSHELGFGSLLHTCSSPLPLVIYLPGVPSLEAPSTLKPSLGPTFHSGLFEELCLLLWSSLFSLQESLSKIKGLIHELTKVHLLFLSPC